MTAGADGCRVIKHPWQRYFMNVIPSRRYNPFHLCDMMVKAAGVLPSGEGLRLSVSEEEAQKARALLGENGVSGDDLLIGFQLGASHDLKSWPAASFARLADRFAESLGARILLTGSKSEERLGKEFESRAAAKAVNLIGKTDLRGAAALLKRCALLVTNDTGAAPHRDGGRNARRRPVARARLLPGDRPVRRGGTTWSRRTSPAARAGST